jgi:hypothetical protein
MLGRLVKLIAALGGLINYDWDNCDDFFEDIKKRTDIPPDFFKKYSERSFWDTYAEDTNIWSYFSSFRSFL